jgi:hypothetical protein
MLTLRFLNNLDELNGAEAFLSAYKFKPYHYYHDIVPERLSEFFRTKLKGGKEMRFLAAFESNKIIIIISFCYLPWDSEIYNLRMGRILFTIVKENVNQRVLSKSLKAVTQEMRSEGFDFVDISVNTHEIKTVHALESNGFRFMGTSVIYGINMTNKTITPIRPKGIIFKEIEKSHVQEMLKLAKNAFVKYGINLNRFYLDMKLPREKVSLMYKEWLANCISDEQADKVFIAELGKKAIGFIACKIENESEIGKRIGRVPLNAVAKEYSGRGLYKGLVAKSLKWFIEKKCDYVETKTQISTVAPQHVWQMYGGRLVDSAYSFHKWFK